MEHVFDSVCRCFGGVPATASTARREARSSSSSPQSRRGEGKKQQSTSSRVTESKRRTSRLQLQDTAYDGLFQHKPKQTKEQQQPESSKPLQYQHQVPANPDLEHARAVAQAKLAGASPTRRGAPKPSSTTRSFSSSKRKSPATKRDEIFRSRRFEPPNMRSSTPGQPQNPSNPVSRLLNNHPGVANALCFATPIRDGDDDAVPLNEPDDDSTLNTCEDTITSTLYFDAKYAHLVEKRPPMPLFSHFKVTDEEDHIRRIVATDSHNSLNMIRLMNENNSNHVLEDTSSEEDEHVIDRSNVLQHSIPRQRPASIRMERPPEPVKINSSGSTKSTASTAPSSSSFPPFPESGRVVHLS